MYYRKFIAAIISVGAVFFASNSYTQECNVGGPYSVDEHTLLLLHFDGNHQGVQGEVPTDVSGTEFREGMFSQGVFFQDLDTLHYDPAGNIALGEGTVEFWVQPDWLGLEDQIHAFFEIGYWFWADRLKIVWDTVSIRVQTFDSTGESGIATFAYNWVPGEWHHIAFTWIGTDIEFYVDAQLVGAITANHFPTALDSPIRLGSACPWGGVTCGTPQAAYAVIDEFRISDTKRCIGQIAPPVPEISCDGFEPPMAAGPVKVKGNRALPLKAQIFDTDGYAITHADLTAPPVVQVWYEYDTPAEDLIEVEALPAGQGDEGNQFVFTDDFKWQFNLKTSTYTASGTYAVFMESGDNTEYQFEEPTCTAEFVIK